MERQNKKATRESKRNGKKVKGKRRGRNVEDTKGNRMERKGKLKQKKRE